MKLWITNLKKGQILLFSYSIVMYIILCLCVCIFIDIELWFTELDLTSLSLISACLPGGGGLRKYPPKIQKAPFLRKLLMEKYTYIYVNFSKFDPYEFKFTKYSPFWKNFLRSDKHFCLIGQEKDTYLRIKKIYTFH